MVSQSCLTRAKANKKWLTDISALVRGQQHSHLQLSSGDQPVPDTSNLTDRYGWVLNNYILGPLWTEEEEELTLPQTVIDNLFNDVPDSDEEEENDRECVLLNGLGDTQDFSSKDSDEE